MLTLWREGGEPLTAGTREITHRIRRSGLRPPSPPLPSVPESDGEAVVATPVQVTGYAVYTYAGVDRDGITSFAASEDLERVVKVIDIAP